jgi:hypothetical protein
MRKSGEIGKHFFEFFAAKAAATVDSLIFHNDLAGPGASQR